MCNGRMEPQLKPLIVPRPPAHHCGKWRSMRGKNDILPSGIFFQCLAVCFKPQKVSYSRENGETSEFVGFKAVGQHHYSCIMDDNGDEMCHMVRIYLNPYYLVFKSRTQAIIKCTLIHYNVFVCRYRAFVCKSKRYKYIITYFC